MSLPKHILLVSYVFPPYYGVGGRRWAKHAAELTRLGYVVHVLCAKNPFEKNSLWWDLVKDNPNIIIHQLPRRYPKVLVRFDHSFIHKVLYKFWVTILPFLTKGSYLDRTIFWEKVMLRNAKRIILKYQIRHVICTGGPFGVLYQITKLRKWFPDIFILNDLRDPWTWGPNWGYPDLPPERKAYELELESKAIERANLFSVPSLDMYDFLKTRYPDLTDKFIHIPHFFDPEEAVCLPKTKAGKIRMVMYGNIYHGIQPYIDALAQLMGQYADQFSLDIYTDKQQYRNLFAEKHATSVRFMDQLNARELFSRFANYDYVFLFNPSYNINNLSTKFFEIIATRTPIILFGAKGRGSDFLVQNKLGLQADLEDIDGLFRKLIAGTLDFHYNKDYTIQQFSLSKITSDISDILSHQRAFSAGLNT